MDKGSYSKLKYQSLKESENVPSQDGQKNRPQAPWKITCYIISETATESDHYTFHTICLTAHIKRVDADRPSVRCSQ